MAATFEDERGSAKVSRNLLAIAVSGVLLSDGRPSHLLTRTRRACFSGTGPIWPPNGRCGVGRAYGQALLLTLGVGCALNRLSDGGDEGVQTSVPLRVAC